MNSKYIDLQHGNLKINKLKTKPRKSQQVDFLTIIRINIKLLFNLIFKFKFKIIVKHGISFELFPNRFEVWFPQIGLKLLNPHEFLLT